MLTRTHITILLLGAMAVWAASLGVLGLPITWEYSKPFTITVAALSVGCFAFDRWIWKWPLIRQWFSQRPDLNGTWKATLQSDWVNPETKQGIGPIECIMTIRQTYSQLSARLFTAESSSYAVSQKIVRQNDGVYQLFATYQNAPDIMLRGKRSEIHFGAFVLELRGEPAVSLVGHYWTDRGTKGSLTLSDRISKILTSYQEGVEQFSLTPKPTT